MNTLIHEQKHRDDKANDITSTYESHVGVYIHQMADESFKMTTEDFQEGMIVNMLSYILGVKNRANREKLIDVFNNSNSTGFEIGKSYKSGYGWEVKINNQTRYIRVLKKAETAN